MVIAPSLHAWCGGHFLLPGWHTMWRWKLWQCHCCQILRGLGKVQKTVAQSARQSVLSLRLYGYTLQQWNMRIKTSDLQLLHCNDSTMICWICSTKDQDETPIASLLQKLGIDNVMAILCSQCVRWSRHTVCHVLYQICHRFSDSWHQRVRKA